MKGFETGAEYLLIDSKGLSTEDLKTKEGNVELPGHYFSLMMKLLNSGDQSRTLSVHRSAIGNVYSASINGMRVEECYIRAECIKYFAPIAPVAAEAQIPIIHPHSSASAIPDNIIQFPRLHQRLAIEGAYSAIA
ncbi:hypothetical protein HYQ22_gp014 [Acinetobacter phage vB_AbaM_Kimel]|uniref:Uncharacterized protein n=1 Tax=Acinetobacter phage vB_AbaM_Kimel TaxID=2686303 RepID=A0A6B9M1U8_9CAUD|nr:hypothetical protein HYQ22_gp014 [Acinetobacter phage vB_AbaM_Kimel]QHB48169.1 hypothetical protein Kimel_014 [Acinetobacter phage vB_AbaM_Kimel]